jgi:hypothetical protein
MHPRHKLARGFFDVGVISMFNEVFLVLSFFLSIISDKGKEIHNRRYLGHKFRGPTGCEQISADFLKRDFGRKVKKELDRITGLKAKRFATEEKESNREN